MSKFQVIMIVAVIAFLLINDFTSEYKYIQAVGSIFVLAFIVVLVSLYQKKAFTGMAEITKEKLFVGQAAQNSEFSSIQTKIVSSSKITPVQFAQVLCDEELRLSLRFKNKDLGEVDRLSNTEKGLQ